MNYRDSIWKSQTHPGAAEDYHAAIESHYEMAHPGVIKADLGDLSNPGT